MNYQGFIILLIGCPLLVLFGCKEKEPALPTILVSPSNLEVSVEPGEVVTFTISMEAEAGLNKLVIEERINGGALKSVLDTTLNQKNNASIGFEYQMLETQDSSEVLLVFKATDEVGQIASNSRLLVINANYTKLDEIKGIKLFSGFSDSSNAYLIDFDSVDIDTNLILSEVDIISKDTSDALLREWESPRQNKFVKFNSFNYDSASYASISKAYQLGIESSRANSISKGDIFLVHLASSPDFEYAAIKVTSVVDNVGSANDYYVFNIKK